MKVCLGAFAALALLFAAGCTTTKAGPPPPAPPVIKTFTADKVLINSGETVTLTFTTSDAKDVSLIDQTGDTIPVTGSVDSGKATVKPTKTSFYVLRVTGAGGKDSAFIQVAVNEGLRQVFLIAVPTEVASGDPVELVWSALGGTNVSVKDSTGATLSTNEESGTRSASPEKTTTWTLRADGPNGMMSATARVTVRPVVKEFSAAPPAAKQGGKIRLTWRTAGADDVVVKEQTFGELTSTTTDVATGSLDFTVPTDFNATDGGTLADGGVPTPSLVPDNFPLKFTLTARTNSPLQAVTAQLDSVVRDGPVINVFDAPAAVSDSKPFTLTWNVSAFRSQILLDGTPVYSTIPPASANGSLTLPGISADTVVTLVAYDYLGLKVAAPRTVKVVKPPKIVTFTLPAQVATAGSSANAMWTTMNAALVVLRIKNGPSQFTTSAMAQVNAGTATVNPARDTTFVLEAYNAAGDVDTLEKTVTVATPATASATPNPTSPNTDVTLSWDVSGLNPVEIVGIPSEVVAVTPNATSFVDLDNVATAQKLFFADRSDGTASFTTPNGFKFPFIASAISKFTVGVNGFIALAAAAPPLSTNVDLKGTASLPTVPLIAPFWDNLDLGANGDVAWAIDGATFPRRLTIQWTKVNVGGDLSSNLTFQVQLFETGEIRFVYKTLSDAAMAFSQGQSATVGIFAGATVFAGQHSYNAATLAEGQEVTWFTQGAATGTSMIKVGGVSVTPGFFYKTAGGGYVYVSIPVRVFGPNSVEITEAMPVPDSSAPMGQYVELYNAQAVDLDLTGLQLAGTVTPMPGFTFPAGTTLPAKSYLVLGQSVDAQVNGDAQVTVAYGTDVVFGSGADGVRLQIPGTSAFEISKLTWTTATANESIQRETVLGTLTCTRTQKFGTQMSVGTPGKRNESCFEYTLENIPVSYFDISSNGSVVTTGDSSVGTLDLASGPFPFFKMNATTAKVSTNGFVNFDSTNTDSYTSNLSAPSTTATNKGSVAIFWDDLDSNDTVPDSNVFAKRMAAGADPANPGAHWIIQWHHYEHWLTSPHDDLNFQMKLFDTGVIEFHYATMTSGTTSNYATGNSATVWLNTKSGAASLAIGVNQPVIQPNTAYRFVPKP